jgi:hypothetical protein
MAGFDIQIVLGEDEKNSSVSTSGAKKRVITDADRTTFGLDDNTLKKSIELYFGQWPTDAYLRSPTPWDDLYKRYNWQEVEVVMKVIDARIIEFEMAPYRSESWTYTNNSQTEYLDINSKITKKLSNTSSNSWSVSNNIDLGFKVNYNIVPGPGGELSMKYSRQWVEAGSSSETVELDVEHAVNLHLAPMKSVNAHITGYEGTVKIRVFYEAYLTGSSAVNYENTYKGHHFHDLDIGAIMNANPSLSKTVAFSEDISINNFSKTSIVLEDGE